MVLWGTIFLFSKQILVLKFPTLTFDPKRMCPATKLQNKRKLNETILTIKPEASKTISLGTFLKKVPNRQYPKTAFFWAKNRGIMGYHFFIFKTNFSAYKTLKG